MTAKIKSKAARPARAEASKAPATATDEPASAPTLAKPNGKTVAVVTLLSREKGATLAEITGLTGWRAHSARAALTGLRKKGHRIERTKRDDVTCYRVVEVGPS